MARSTNIASATPSVVTLWAIGNGSPCKAFFERGVAEEDSPAATLYVGLETAVPESGYGIGAGVEQVGSGRQPLSEHARATPGESFFSASASSTSALGTLSLSLKDASGDAGSPGINVERPAQKAQFESLFADLVNLGKLGDNWNGYGAEKPNATAIDSAKRVLLNLRSAGLLPTRILPSAENGIAIVFVVNGAYADVECFNDGDILAAKSEGSGDPVVWNVDDMETTVREIREFLLPRKEAGA